MPKKPSQVAKIPLEGTDLSAPIPEPMPQIVEVSERVYFEGRHVDSILQDGKELRDSEGKITHYHCSLDNGTTAHVPVTLFV